MRIRTIGLVIIAFFVIGLAYLPSFQGSWVFDDTANILQAKGVWVQELSLSELKDAAFSFKDNRPLARLTYGLNYYFGQKDTFGYHLFNLCVHLATFLVLFLFLRRVLRLPVFQGRFEDKADWIALAGALIWAVHPMNVQSVTYIVQRMTSMSGFFVVLCLYFYLRARQSDSSRRIWAYFGGAFLSVILGMLCKENAAVAPLLVLALEGVLIQKGNFDFILNKRVLLSFGVVFLVAVGLVALSKPDVIHNTLGRYLQNDVIPGISKGFTPWERLITQPRVVCLYLAYFFIPLIRFYSLERYPDLSDHLLDPWTTIPAILLILGLIVFGVKVRKKWPLVSLTVLWFFLAHSIEVLVPGLDLMYDHRMYVPSMFIPLAAITSLYALTGRVEGREQVYRYGFLGICLVALAVLSVQTYRYNQVWDTRVGIWEHTLRLYPDDARPTYNMAEACLVENQKDKSRDYFQKAAELKSDWWRPYWGLGKLAVKSQDFEQAEKYIGKVLDMNRQELENYQADDVLMKTMALMSFVQVKLGNKDKAIEFAKTAKPEKYPTIQTYDFLGKAMLQSGRFDLAARYFEQGLEYHSYNRDFRENAASSYGLMGNKEYRQGNFDQALDYYKRSLDLKPGYSPVMSGLMLVHWKKGNADKAIKYGEKAVSLDSADNSTRSKFAKVLKSAGNKAVKNDNLETGIKYYRRALNYLPKNKDILNNLAWWLATSSDPEVRDTEEALNLAQKAAKVTNYQDPVVLDTLAEALTRNGKYQQALEYAKKSRKFGRDLDGFDIAAVEDRIQSLRKKIQAQEN